MEVRFPLPPPHLGRYTSYPLHGPPKVPVPFTAEVQFLCLGLTWELLLSSVPKEF